MKTIHLDDSDYEHVLEVLRRDMREEKSKQYDEQYGFYHGMNARKDVRLLEMLNPKSAAGRTPVQQVPSLAAVVAVHTEQGVGVMGVMMSETSDPPLVATINAVSVISAAKQGV